MKVLHRLIKKKATTLSDEKLKEKKEKILGISMSCDAKIHIFHQQKIYSACYYVAFLTFNLTTGRKLSKK